MIQKFFNFYKYKRIFGRKISHAKNELIAPIYPCVNPKDYSWHSAKTNPYEEQGGCLKRKICFAIIIFCFVSIFLIASLHPFFVLTNIKIKGFERISETEFREALKGICLYKKLFLFSSCNYFFVDLDKIRDILKERFPIESIKITKFFPKELNIELAEKLSTVIFDNGKLYSYVGLDGNVVEILRLVGDDEWQIKTKTTTSTLENGEIKTENIIEERKHAPNNAQLIKEFGNYPIIYLKNDERDYLPNTAVLDQNAITNIVNFYTKIETNTDLNILYIELDSQAKAGEAILYIKGGWNIKIKTENIDKQFDQLMLILKKIGKQNLEYIDLRYDGRVYMR
jgi:cell division septal protein FtsQ